MIFSHYSDHIINDVWSMDHRCLIDHRDRQQPPHNTFHNMLRIQSSMRISWVLDNNFLCYHIQMFFCNILFIQFHSRQKRENYLLFTWKKKKLFIKHSYHERLLLFGLRKSKKKLCLGILLIIIFSFECLSLSRVVIKVSKQSACCYTQMKICIKLSLTSIHSWLSADIRRRKFLFHFSQFLFSEIKFI